MPLPIGLPGVHALFHRWGLSVVTVCLLVLHSEPCPDNCRKADEMTQSEITLRDIYLAKQTIASIRRKTPLVLSPALSDCAGGSVFLKLESLQETGSFKIRGAANKILSLTQEERARGVVTGSSGNHGRAVAFMAKNLGIDAVVCVSDRTPRNKVSAIRDLGAAVVLHGESYDEAVDQALRLVEERELTLIDSFDDPHVIAGQGTIGIELLEALPEIDTAIVPLGGGGLLCGIALALKSADPSIRVVGVSMERAPVMYQSLKVGKPIKMEEEETIAHALAGGLGQDNRYTFRMTQKYVDDVVLVSEGAIAEAMAVALEQHHMVVEGAGAVGIAAVLHGKAGIMGRNVAVVVSGCNVDSPLLLRVAKQRASGDVNSLPRV
jgi:threonine dehydratase